MLHFQSTSRLSVVTFFAAILLLASTSVYAKTGCCSKHGGVAGCDNSTGYQLCKDGTNSPSCTCSGQTVKQTKTTAAKKSYTTAAKPASKSTVMTQTTLEKAKTGKAKDKAKEYQVTGCCSGHGGVAKCDTKKGYQVCKDGTHSATCTCEKKSKKK